MKKTILAIMLFLAPFSIAEALIDPYNFTGPNDCQEGINNNQPGGGGDNLQQPPQDYYQVPPAEPNEHLIHILQENEELVMQEHNRIEELQGVQTVWGIMLQGLNGEDDEASLAQAAFYRDGIERLDGEIAVHWGNIIQLFNQEVPPFNNQVPGVLHHPGNEN